MKRIDCVNKIAIVTGASSGIGKEISTILVKKYGCTVYGIARDLRKLDVVREELGHKNFLCCVMDVSAKHSWEKFDNFLENSHTSPAILVNCAGILPRFASFENTSLESFEKTVDVNFMSCVYSCKYIMPHMEKGGVVINVSSASALCPFGGVGSYSASKAALERFTESLSCESRDISVSCAMPGFVKTNIMKGHNVTEKEKGIIGSFSADPTKVASKILNKARKRKKRIVVGTDAHFMSFMYRAFPRFAPKLFTKIIKKSNLELFKNV
ncbi:MAG: SDR family NAD(P)-dependent oxidoreductase [Ruminococcaceae bacterium]|nr:SDR family NAD(P)-dependent oxidoreductase [Oscillospiraceae bacterium]